MSMLFCVAALLQRLKLGVHGSQDQGFETCKLVCEADLAAKFMFEISFSL
jgi:hypothetical protein